MHLGLEEFRKELDRANHVLELRSKAVWCASVRGSGTITSIYSLCPEKNAIMDCVPAKVDKWFTFDEIC